MVPIFNGECGTCECCKCVKTNICTVFGVNPLMKVMASDGRSRFWSKDGKKPIYHFLNTSTFSEYSVLQSACVVKVGSQLAPHLKKLTLLSCGVSTGNFFYPKNINGIICDHRYYYFRLFYCNNFRNYWYFSKKKQEIFLSLSRYALGPLAVLSIPWDPDLIILDFTNFKSFAQDPIQVVSRHLWTGRFG